LAHLVPQNTPYLIIQFLIIIELIRNFIRPFTLSLRLSANIAAGHLLLIILREFTRKNYLILIILRLLVISILIRLELGVSIIQRYVFRSLILLYIKDINFRNLYL
jgi:F-type H+-transporting ATPase subunit a